MKRSSTLRRALVVTYALSAAAATASADPAPNPNQCPAAAPARDSACTAPSLHCGYRPCGSSFSLHAICDPATHRWTIAERTCNPPPPTRNPPAPRH